MSLYNNTKAVPIDVIRGERVCSQGRVRHAEGACDCGFDSHDVTLAATYDAALVAAYKLLFRHIMKRLIRAVRTGDLSCLHAQDEQTRVAAREAFQAIKDEAEKQALKAGLDAARRLGYSGADLEISARFVAAEATRDAEQDAISDAISNAIEEVDVYICPISGMRKPRRRGKPRHHGKIKFCAGRIGRAGKTVSAGKNLHAGKNRRTGKEFMVTLVYDDGVLTSAHA